MKECKFCKVSFYPSTSNQKFCNRAYCMGTTGYSYRNRMNKKRIEKRQFFAKIMGKVFTS